VICLLLSLKLPTAVVALDYGFFTFFEKVLCHLLPTFEGNRVVRAFGKTFNRWRLTHFYVLKHIKVLHSGRAVFASTFKTQFFNHQSQKPIDFPKALRVFA